jgi:hypothetical protein
MQSPFRIAIPVLVSTATLMICFLGVRTELNIAKRSIAEHRLHAQLAHQAAESKADRDKRPNISP